MNAHGKFASLRVFLHTETTESFCLMGSKVKMQCHPHLLSILTGYGISLDFNHSSFSFSSESSLLQHTYRLLTSKRWAFSKYKDWNPFWNQWMATLTFTSKGRTSVSSLKTKKTPSLPYTQPHKESKSLVTHSMSLTSTSHQQSLTRRWKWTFLPARHSCVNAKTQNGYYKWRFLRAKDLHE